LLGVGLISGGMGIGVTAAGPALAQDAGTIGAVAAVKPDAFGAAPSAAEQTLNVGAGLVENEKIRTDENGTANVIFADRSTLTVGKGSEVTLDKFVYDPASKAGGIALNLAQGALRFIGGQLSKTGDVSVKTPTATMTIRGAIGLFYFPGGGQDGYAVFLYGKELKLEGGDSLYRPGYAFRFPADGGPPEIVKITDELLAKILAAFNTETGFGGQLPDQDIADLGTDPNLAGLIDDLQNQIKNGPKDSTILDSLNQFLSGNAFVPPISYR